jgi:cobaltochelatase CobT
MIFVPSSTFESGVKNPTDGVRSTLQKRDANGVIRHGAEWLTLWSDPDSLKTAVEKRSAAIAVRERIAIEHRLAAAARSLSGNPKLQVAFQDSPTPLHLDDYPSDSSGLRALRGQFDSYAFIQRFHSPDVHREHAPRESPYRELFDLCEEVRCEAMGMAQFPGVRTNIVAHHSDRLERSDLLNAHLASLIPLGEGLRVVLRDSLVEAPETSIDSAGFRMWNQWIRARFSQTLAAMCVAQSDQAAYAPLSFALIRGLIAELGSGDGKKRRFQPTNKSGSEKIDEPEGNSVDRLKEEEHGEIFEPGGDILPESLPRPLQWSAAREGEQQAYLPYKSYTTAHDVVICASDLVEPSLLREKRAYLESKYRDYGRDLARLVSRLQRRLMSRQTRDWAFDLDEGLIDASRLDRVIVNPGFDSPYKQEQDSEFRDSAVSILVDNSGSMRGKPIEMACLASTMLAAALERCGVSCEILGFTTRGWQGGQSAKDWARAGRPADPGRLNDLLHIVYKSYDEPARRSRLALCAMLESSHLKENIDGEALLWAWRRLLARYERRKILIVVSDGAPVDEMTLQENQDKTVLDRHLRKVIADIENSYFVELAAVGVKHDVKQYYRNSIYIDKAEKLGVSLINLIDQLLPR